MSGSDVLSLLVGVVSVPRVDVYDNHTQFEAASTSLAAFRSYVKSSFLSLKGMPNRMAVLIQHSDWYVMADSVDYDATVSKLQELLQSRLPADVWARCKVATAEDDVDQATRKPVPASSTNGAPSHKSAAARAFIASARWNPANQHTLLGLQSLQQPAAG